MTRYTRDMMSNVFERESAPLSRSRSLSAQRFRKDMLGSSSIFSGGDEHTAPCGRRGQASPMRSRASAATHSSEGVQSALRGDLIKTRRRIRGEGLAISNKGHNADGLWRDIPFTARTRPDSSGKRRRGLPAAPAAPESEDVTLSERHCMSPLRTKSVEAAQARSLAGPGKATMVNKRHAARKKMVTLLEEQSCEFEASKARFLGVGGAPDARRAPSMRCSSPTAEKGVPVAAAGAGTRLRSSPELLPAQPQSEAQPHCTVRNTPRLVWTRTWAQEKKLGRVPSGRSTLSTLTPSSSQLCFDAESCYSGVPTPPLARSCSGTISCSGTLPRAWA